MNTVQQRYSTGVIVARLQVPWLTEAHKELIQTVLDKHPKVLIFLGLSPLKGTINDPFDFQPRKQMVLEEYPHTKYPNLHIGYIKDMRGDEEWSKQLDSLIRDQLSPKDTVVLYGSRDSFIPHYKGGYPTIELEQTRDVSGSELRLQVAQAPQSDPKFRAGVVWATHQRFPTVYSTVDVLLFDTKERRILLGRKPAEKQYRYIGGFADPTDESFEKAAARELYEESTLPAGTIEYVGSQRVDDWRYRNNPSEKIITHLFLGTYTFGSAKAADDIAEVRWFKYDDFNAELNLVEEHRPMWAKYKAFIDAKWPDRFEESVKQEIEINELLRVKIIDTKKANA